MEVDQALEIVAGASDAELREIAAYRMHGPLVRSLAATALHGRETGAFAWAARKQDGRIRALLRALSGDAGGET